MLSGARRQMAAARPLRPLAAAAWRRGYLSPTLASVPEPTYRQVKYSPEELSPSTLPGLRAALAGNKIKDTPMDQPAAPEGGWATSLPPPDLEFSVLENGMRVVTVDKGGVTALLGLFVDAGSAFETEQNVGVSHMAELMAWRSSELKGHLDTAKELEALGVSAVCQSNREHILYQAECLRDAAGTVVPLMMANVTAPLLLPDEMAEACHGVFVARDNLERNPSQLMTELLHHAAYPGNTLGRPMHCQEDNIANITPDAIRGFMGEHFRPERMVFVAVNVDHEETTKWVARSFLGKDYGPRRERPRIQPVYQGGDMRIPADLANVHISLGFEYGGWNSEDLVSVTVLNTLLGGGGAFSTGGPGKGMHTRLFTNVMNRYSRIESTMAFSHAHENSGLFGVSVECMPEAARDAAGIILAELAKLGSFTDEEFQRAKNSLKQSITMNLESKAVVVEDTGRQLLMSSRVATGKQFRAMVDAVEPKDLTQVVVKMLEKPATLVSYGPVQKVPDYAAVAQACNQVKEQLARQL